jgi:hypothetical protein
VSLGSVSIATVHASILPWGVLIDPEDLAAITPYITSRIRRFGDWKLDLTPPAALDIEVL